MSAARIWLQHGEHGGYFECPVDAVPEFALLGWEPSDAPPEFNPVTAEMPKTEVAAVVAVDPKPATKPGKGSPAAEGSN
jgi:hypothetical protein